MPRVTGSASVYLDRPVGAVLDFLERTYLPSRPGLHGSRVVRATKTATASTGNGAGLTNWKLVVEEAGPGSKLTVDLEMPHANALGYLLVSRKIGGTASGIAAAVKDELARTA